MGPLMLERLLTIVAKVTNRAWFWYDDEMGHRRLWFGRLD